MRKPKRDGVEEAVPVLRLRGAWRVGGKGVEPVGGRREGRDDGAGEGGNGVGRRQVQQPREGAGARVVLRVAAVAAVEVVGALAQRLQGAVMGQHICS